MRRKQTDSVFFVTLVSSTVHLNIRYSHILKILIYPYYKALTWRLYMELYGNLYGRYLQRLFNVAWTSLEAHSTAGTLRGHHRGTAGDGKRSMSGGVLCWIFRIGFTYASVWEWGINNQHVRFDIFRQAHMRITNGGGITNKVRMYWDVIAGFHQQTWSYCII